MDKIVFKISGMRCHSCAKIIKLELEEEVGATNVNVDYGSQEAQLEFDPEKTSEQKIINKIESLGYKAIKK